MTVKTIYSCQRDPGTKYVPPQNSYVNQMWSFHEVAIWDKRLREFEGANQGGDNDLLETTTCRRTLMPKKGANQGDVKDLLEAARWLHTKGVGACFAETPAGAALEVLRNTLNLGLSASLSQTHWLLTRWTLDLDLATTPFVDPSTLPAGWVKVPALRSCATQLIGDKWLIEGKHLALRVPSAVLPPEMGWNYLINTAHPDFKARFINASKTPYSWSDYLGIYPTY